MLASDNRLLLCEDSHLALTVTGESVRETSEHHQSLQTSTMQAAEDHGRFRGTQVKRTLVSLRCRCLPISHVSHPEKPRPPVLPLPLQPGNKSLSNSCRFFKWLDQVESHQVIDIPLCACGAGICRIEAEASGPNAGRKFFVCPIKKGQGACNYFLWQDAEENLATSYTGDESSSFPLSILTACTGTRPSKNNLVEEGEPTNLGREIHSLTAETLQFCNDLVSTSSPLKRNKVPDQLKGSKEKSDEPSRKGNTRVRHTASESHGNHFGSSFEGQALLPNLEFSLNEEPTQDSFQALTIKGDGKTNEFRIQNSFQETVLTAACSFSSTYSDSSTLPTNLDVLLGRCLVVSMTHQDIHVQFHGLFYRLAFCPSRSLMEPAPKPFFCCVFPSFDPISDSKNVSLCVPASSLGRSFGAETYSQPLTRESQRPLHPQRNSIMAKSVSKAFSRAGEQLQNDLLTLLKSMDIKDHETMSQEANATFAALDQLCIDHQKFSGQVKELIRCASLLAKIDQSISNDHSCEVLLDRFNSEKMKLHEIDDAFLASKRRLMLLFEEVSHLKDKLSQIEADLCCCQAENLVLKAQMVQVAEAKGKARETFQTAFKELKSAYRLRELWLHLRRQGSPKRRGLAASAAGNREEEAQAQASCTVPQFLLHGCEMSGLL